MVTFQSPKQLPRQISDVAVLGVHSVVVVIRDFALRGLKTPFRFMITVAGGS